MREAKGVKQLLAGMRALLGARRVDRLEAFLAEWPVEGAARRVRPTALPVLSYEAILREQAPAWVQSVVDAVFRLAPSLHWAQSYPESAVGAQFLENYGWTEIAGLKGPIASERVAVGFLILGPATLYPRHRHEAEEIYVPLSGTAEWQGGAGLWQPQPPGTVLVHERDEPHAMRTSREPLLALYLWRSRDLAQSSQLDPRDNQAIARD